MSSVPHVPKGDKEHVRMMTFYPIDDARFGSRIREKFLGMDVVVSAPEDTMLAKFRWARYSGGSENSISMR